MRLDTKQGLVRYGLPLLDIMHVSLLATSGKSQLPGDFDKLFIDLFLLHDAMVHELNVIMPFEQKSDYGTHPSVFSAASKLTAQQMT